MLFRYWTLKSLEVSFTGTYTGGTIAISKTGLDVHKEKTGLTKSLGDVICSRKYSFCAPKNLCWKCDDQIISASEAADNANLQARLTMPGVKLQPNLANSTEPMRYIDRS